MSTEGAAYRAENSSKVSSSCAPLLRRAVVLKAALLTANWDVGVTIGARPATLETIGRKKREGRAAKRSTDVEAIALVVEMGMEEWRGVVIDDDRG